MPETDPHDEVQEDGWLADYRRTVERLRGETEAEFGSQPMPPEALSVIALAIVSLPLLALLLPPVPLEPTVWQVGFALLAVWLAAFRIQSVRYARFHELWQRKVVAHVAQSSAAADAGLRQGRY
jgi:hypothetical protein